jgi:hypothetical protein
MAPRPTILTLSSTRRRVYSRLLIGVFVLAVPVLFLYATGYRFEGLTVWTKTGGIYVGAELPGAEIYLDGELVHEIGTFRRAFYIEDLDPDSYTVVVSKGGYQSWEKTLEVQAHRVTEAQAFNLHKEPLLILIPPITTNQTPNATTAPTSTPPVVNPLYQRIRAAFATTTATSTVSTLLQPKVRAVGLAISTTTALVATTTKEFLGMQLYDEGTRVGARWMREKESIPFYFCIQDGVCVDTIALDTKEKPSHFDFFPGTTDLALVTLRDGVYVIELDNRSKQNIQSLFLAAGADFRVIDGGIYVRTPSEIYKVEI